MASKNTALAIECMRLSESCLYTSTSFFIWLWFLRCLRVIFVVTPVVLGSFGGWQLLTEAQAERIRTLAALASFLAGIFPAVYAALKYDDRLARVSLLAGEFKNLQDRFRQAARVSALKTFLAFEQDVAPLVKRLEAARSDSVTPPEWCFRAAQKKIKKGDYDFDVDAKAIESASSAPDTGANDAATT
jgi:hypothetical protein